MSEIVDYGAIFKKVLTGESQGEIVVGDCLDVMAQMPDGCVDLIFADPPFPGRNDMGGGKGKLKEWLAPMPRLTDKAIIKWSAIALPEAAASIPLGWKWQHTMVWHKPWTNARHWALDIYPHWEALLVLGIGGRRGELPAVQDVILGQTLRAGMLEDVGHCMQTPESVLALLIRAFSLPGDLIFDPFVGSGTTAVVARRLGRNFFGCDVSPAFVEMALTRMSQRELEIDFCYPDYVEMSLKRLEKDGAARQLQLLQGRE